MLSFLKKSKNAEDVQDDIKVDEPSKKELYTITLPNCEANIRYARDFKRCSYWSFDKSHDNINITFNENRWENDIELFKSLTNRDPKDNYYERLALKILEHIKNNGNLWDMYRDVDDNINGHLKTESLEITIMSKYFSGFMEEKDDRFYVKIKCKDTKIIAFNQTNVSYYILEDFHNVLAKVMYEREKGLFEIVQREMDRLCGE